MRKLLLLSVLSVLVTSNVMAHINCIATESACALPVMRAFLDIQRPSKTSVNDLCTMYDKFGKCITRNNLDILCPKTYVKVAVDVLIGYICGKNKQEFLDNMECMHDAQGRLQSTDCQESMATALKGIILEATFRDRHDNVSAPSFQPIYEAGVCASLSLGKCFATMMDERCGYAAGDWVQNMVKNIIEGFRSAYNLPYDFNCTKPREQNMPALPLQIPMKPVDCGNSTIESYLNTCLYAGFVNIPLQPVRIPTYADLVLTMCRGWRLDKCWHPVREACPAVVNTVYDQVIVTTLSTCSAAKTTIATGCDLIDILGEYISSSMCNTGINDYLVEYFLSLAIHRSSDEIWKFINVFSSKRGGEWLVCLKDGVDTALPEIRRTCGKEMAMSVKEFNSQINVLAQYMFQRAKAYPKP